MDPIARALDQCLAHVDAGRSPDEALAGISDAALRRHVAPLLATALAMSGTTFARPQPVFRTGLGRQLADMDVALEPPLAAPAMARPALLIAVGVCVLLAAGAGVAGWTRQQAANGLETRVLATPRATMPATAIARHAPAHAALANLPAGDPSPTSRPTASGQSVPRLSARTIAVFPPPSATSTQPPVTLEPTMSAVPSEDHSPPDTPLPPNPSPNNSATTVTIAGHVTRDDMPLANVTVVAVRSEPGTGCRDLLARDVATTQSDADGGYQLTDLPPGDYRIRAEGGPQCLLARWHVGQLGLGSPDGCRATVLELKASAETTFVDVRFGAGDVNRCPSATP